MKRTTLTAVAVAIAAALILAVAVGAFGRDDSPAVRVPTTTTTDQLSPGTVPITSSTFAPSDDYQLAAEVAQVTGDWPTEWSRRTIDTAELKLGINALDPRDRIAPLDGPSYESLESAGTWLIDRELGVRLELDGTALFYPLRILTAHEIVNDEIGGIPFAVTYCPLCNTAIAFDRRVGGEVLRFGVSGLLRKSDLVMWDDKTTSLWQQISGEGIVGVYAGTRLDVLPTSVVRWGDFRENDPDGEVLSIDTGFRFGYGSNAYVGYSNRTAPYATFFDQELDERFPALSRVVGVRVDESHKAYPFEVIDDERVVNDELAGVPITVWWAPTDSADNFDGDRVGEGAPIGTGIAFLREVDNQVLTFEVIDNQTYRDIETSSTWSLFGEAIAGPLAGAQLELAVHQNEFWFAWAAFHSGFPVHGG